jgi:Bacterial PH domain
VSEYDSEPIPGLPTYLPDGETLIWQGSPDAKGVARRILHTRAVALYFGVLASYPVASAVASGTSLVSAAGTSLRIIIIAATAIGILTVVARLIAKTTIYSLTSKRIVMRYGIAFPITLNIPFNEIAAIDCKAYPNDSSDIALSTSGPLRMSYLNLWPHARSWEVDPAQPALRMLADGQSIARMVAEAMIADGVQGSKAITRQPINNDAKDRRVMGLSSATA